MGPDVYEALEEQYNKLNELYDGNLDAVEQLQATLLNDIVPGLIDELELDVTAVDPTREWLQDTRKSRPLHYCMKYCNKEGRRQLQSSAY